MTYIRNMLKNIGKILGLAATLLCCALFFYHTINDYYWFRGKLTDFSLFGWGLMILIWGGALYFLKQKKYLGLMFAFWVSLLCFALDCQRFWLYSQDENCRLYLQVMMWGELLCFLVFLKKYHYLALFAGASLLITVLGGFFIFPIFMKPLYLHSILLFASLLWLSYLPVKITFYQKMMIFWRRCLGGILILVFLAGIWGIYDRQHGIRFYERPVTEVSEEIKVSVIIPVYNAADTLERTLDSVRHQSLKDIEIIVVDDGSTDNTPEILKKYAAFDKRFKVIRQENAYAGAARNRGIDVAKGEYIGFVDADDWITRDYFEKLYAMAKQQQVDIAAAQSIWMVKSEYPLQMFKYGGKVLYEKDVMIEDLADYRTYVGGYSVDKIYKRSFLEQHHIRFSTLRTAAEDNYFTTLALLYADRMAIVKDIAYYYYKGNMSLTVVKYLSLNDKAVELFVSLDEAIRQADVDEDKKLLWLEVIQKVRQGTFSEYYHALQEDDKQPFWQRIKQAYPDEEFGQILQPAGSAKVSIIIPVYNGAKSVKRTLDSLLAQTLKDIEIIVVDDGSTDETPTILTQYANQDERIKVLHQQNAYVGAARNRGQQEATGEYIAYLDADDTISPDFYEKMYQTALAHDADVVVAEKVVSVWENSNKQELYQERQKFMTEDVITDLSAYRRNVHAYLWDKIYKRSFLAGHHIWGTLRRTPAEDNYLTTQVLMYADKMFVAKGATHYYHRGSASETGVKNTRLEDQIVEVFADIDRLIARSDLSPQKKEEWLDALKEARYKCFRDYYLCLKDEDKPIAIEKMRRYFPSDSFDFEAANDNDTDGHGEHHLYQQLP